MSNIDPNNFINLINLPSSVEIQNKIEELINWIVSQVNKNNFNKNSVTIEVIHYIAQLIANFTDPAVTTTISKQQIFNIVLQKVFPNISVQELTDSDIKAKHLIEIGAVKEIPILKKATSYLYQICKKSLSFFLKKS